MTNRGRVQGIPIWRHDNGTWYADFRSLPGGSRESLGTKDRAEADAVLAERKSELEERAARGVRGADDWELAEFVQKYLDHRTDEVAESTWAEDERALGYLVTYLRRECGREPRLSDVTTQRLAGFIRWRHRRIKASSAHRELASISAMCQRAVEWSILRRNPARSVSRLSGKSDDDSGTKWLEIGEAARVLEAAKAMVADPSSRCRPHFHALVATFLLTGGRRSEVFGLRRSDVDFEAGLVRFEPNEHRGLKTDHSKRDVPLWPQLREILGGHLEDREDASGLLFPAPSGGMLTKIRSALDKLQKRADVGAHLTPLTFRHTYAATRIQTVDRGEAVSPWTVARELGHRSLDRIEDTYGHLQRRRSRLAEVRYSEADVVSLEAERTA